MLTNGIPAFLSPSTDTAAELFLPLTIFTIVSNPLGALGDSQGSKVKFIASSSRYGFRFTEPSLICRHHAHATPTQCICHGKCQPFHRFFFRQYPSFTRQNNFLSCNQLHDRTAFLTKKTSFLEKNTKIAVH